MVLDTDIDNGLRHLLARLISPALALLALVAGLIGCAPDKSVQYDEDRGFYRTDEIKPLDNQQANDLLARGQTLEDAGDMVTAAAWYLGVARKYPTYGVAIKARTRLVKVHIKTREFQLAHQAMTRLVALYKEELQRTRAQALWDELRHIWYDGIGLGLFFKDDTRKEISDDLDPAIKVFDRLLKEEFRGRYAALCLLRIGDCYARKGDYVEARTHYLRVVRNYQGFQDFHEHEEGLYKAALSTLATMKGSEYDLSLIEAPGSDTEEKGALDLCRDYESAYPGGTFTDRIKALEAEIYTVLCWRDYDAARVYESLGQSRAAWTQYKLVVKVWGNAERFPEQQDYVERAKEKIRSINVPDDSD